MQRSASSNSGRNLEYVVTAPELSLAPNSPRTILERELVPLIKPGEYFYIFDGSLVQADEEGGHYSNTARAWIVNDIYGNGYLENEVDEVIPGKKTAFTWEQLCNRAFGVPEDRPKEFAAKDNAYEYMRQVILKEDGYDINDKPEGEFAIDNFLVTEEHIRGIAYLFDESGNYIPELNRGDSVWRIHDDGCGGHCIIEYEVYEKAIPQIPYNPEKTRYGARPLAYAYEDIHFTREETNINTYTSFDRAENVLNNLIAQELEEDIERE